jgi:general secretion pathway protein B
VLAMSELPADVISSLPALVVSGASYSDQPASRMVIINGALYHEGDRLTPDLTLQRIALRSAVLSFRGYRFSINY